MGCKGPKSLISVRNENTFLDLTVQQIEVKMILNAVRHLFEVSSQYQDLGTFRIMEHLCVIYDSFFAQVEQT